MKECIRDFLSKDEINNIFGRKVCFCKAIAKAGESGLGYDKGGNIVYETIINSEADALPGFEVVCTIRNGRPIKSITIDEKVRDSIAVIEDYNIIVSEPKGEDESSEGLFLLHTCKGQNNPYAKRYMGFAIQGF